MDYRTRIDLYLYSGNGEKSSPLGSGEVIFYNLRPQGYLYDPSKYHGCVLCLNSFRSLPMTQTGVESVVNYDGSAIHFQIVEVSQPNSISNFGADSGGVSSYSSNANILRTLQWDNTLQITGNGGDDNFYALGYNASDPMSEGVFISSPLESFTVRLVNNKGVAVNLSATTKDKVADESRDTSWVAHIIIQPILKET